MPLDKNSPEYLDKLEEYKRLRDLEALKSDFTGAALRQGLEMVRPLSGTLAAGVGSPHTEQREEGVDLLSSIGRGLKTLGLHAAASGNPIATAGVSARTSTPEAIEALTAGGVLAGSAFGGRQLLKKPKAPGPLRGGTPVTGDDARTVLDDPLTPAEIDRVRTGARAQQSFEDYLETGIPATKENIEASRVRIEDVDRPGLMLGDGGKAPTISILENNNLALNKAGIRELREQLPGLAELPPTQRKGATVAAHNAKVKGLDRQAHLIADEVLKSKRPISDDEYMAMNLQAAELWKQKRQAMAKADALIEQGASKETIDQIQGELVAIEDSLDKLTRASDLGGREVARSLAIRRYGIKLETLDPVNVSQRGRVAKGAKLTPEERDLLTEKSKKYQQLERELAELQIKFDQTEGQRARLLAEAEVRKTRVGKRVAVKRDKIIQQRNQAKSNLKALGFRMNDITGVTAEASFYIGELAFTYLREGALNVDEIVRKVIADFPDLNSRQVVEGMRTFKERRKVLSIPKEITNKQVQMRAAEKDINHAIAALAPRTPKDVGIEAINALRTAKTVLDVSANFRQNMLLGPARPWKWTLSMGHGFRAFLTKHGAEKTDMLIKSATMPDGTPKQLFRDRAALHLSDDTPLSGTREEFFQSNWLRDFHGVNRIPFVGKPAQKILRGTVGQAVTRSEKAFVTSTNFLRANAFDEILDLKGVTDVEMRDWANFINHASGRGSLGQFAGAANALSLGLFAPRFAASRFQTFNDLRRAALKGDVTSKKIRRSWGAFMGMGLTALYLASLNDDVDVETNPRSPDWGKMRIGNTRVDLWAGHQQTARLMLRLALSGTDKAGLDIPGMGKIRGRREMGPLELVTQFGSYKLAPVVTTSLEALTGRSIVGEDVSPSEVAMRAVTPIVVQDILDLRKEDFSMPLNVALSIGSASGVGVQTFKKKRRRR